MERCQEIVYGDGEVINTPSEWEPNNLGHVHLREGRPSRKGIYASITVVEGEQVGRGRREKQERLC